MQILLNVLIISHSLDVLYSETFLKILFRDFFHYPESSYQVKIENSFTVSVFFQLFLHPINTTTETIHITQHLQTISY